MKLVFLHGAPAAGKLTTARALLAQVSGRLFDNHAAIDVARTVFDFGAPGFFELVQEVRKAVLVAASEQGVALVVMTFVYADPEDLPTFEQFEAIVHQRGGQVLPVYLKCSTEEIVRRVGNADRVARKKMTAENSVRKFTAQYRLAAVPRANCLMLDSEAQSAEANAKEIIRHFGLADLRPV
jgi:hypothetical protein